MEKTEELVGSGDGSLGSSPAPTVGGRGWAVGGAWRAVGRLEGGDVAFLEEEGWREEKEEEEGGGGIIVRRRMRRGGKWVKGRLGEGSWRSGWSCT